VVVSWSFGEEGSSNQVTPGSGGGFSADVVIPYTRDNSGGGTVAVTVAATDAAGNTATSQIGITLEPCGSGT
jgi:hypothetical protein